MRRLAPVLALALVLAAALPAQADEALEDLMQDAAGAEYHGEGIAFCLWGDDAAAATYEVTRSHGMSMVHGPAGDSMAGGGLLAARTGADWHALEIEEWSAWEMSARYTLGTPQPVTRLGRTAWEIAVLEDGRTRARLIVDAESSVPLMSEVFDGTGSRFRLATLVEFSPGTPDMPPMPDEMPATMVEPADPPPRLPTVAGGEYRLADAYAAPGGSVQAFYSDGLFSFSLFESKRSGTPAQFRDATRFEVGGETYLRLVEPTRIWVLWHAPDHTYVLVGDLPPDHLEAVLGDLPEPGNRAFPIRWWRALFG